MGTLLYLFGLGQPCPLFIVQSWKWTIVFFSILVALQWCKTSRQRPLTFKKLAPLHSLCIFFKRLYLFIFRERGKEGEREGANINVWLPLMCRPLGTQPATQACAPTGNRTSDLLVCRPALNPLSHTSQSNTSYVFCSILLSWTCCSAVTVSALLFYMVGISLLCSLMPAK